MRPIRLQLAPQKAEVMIIKGPRKRRYTSVCILGEEIGISKIVKYLGVIFDAGMTFAAHTAHIV